MKHFALVLALCLATFLTGCMTMQTPPYVAEIESYEQLQGQNLRQVSVNDFDVSSVGNRISIRGTPLASSVNDSFGTYLKGALEEEFHRAGLLSKNASCVISGTLLENDINAAGFSTATGHLSSRVVVQDKGKVLYDKVVSAAHQWDSSFVGGVAIRRARDNYPFIVRSFIKNLFGDADFQAALTK